MAIGLIAVSSLGFLGFLGVGAVFGYRTMNQAKELAALRVELREVQQRAASLEREGLSLPDEELDRLVASFRARAERVSGDDARLLRCGAELIAAQARGGQALAKKVREVRSVLEANGLDDAAVVEARLRVLEEFDAANRRVLHGLEGVPTVAERCATREGVGERAKASFLEAVRREPSVRSAAMDVRRVDTEFVVAARDELLLLKELRGRFHHDRASDRLIFPNQADLVRFNRAAEAVRAAAVRSEAASSALRARMEQASRPPSSPTP